jgi:hypothetical protein
MNIGDPGDLGGGNFKPPNNPGPGDIAIMGAAIIAALADNAPKAPEIKDNGSKPAVPSTNTPTTPTISNGNPKKGD